MPVVPTMAMTLPVAAYPPGLSPAASLSTQATSPIHVVNVPLLSSPKSNGAVNNMLPITVRSPTSKPGQIVSPSRGSPKSGLSNVSTTFSKTFSTYSSPGSTANRFSLASCSSPCGRFDQSIHMRIERPSSSGVPPLPFTTTRSKSVSNGNDAGAKSAVNDGDCFLPTATNRSESVSNEFGMPPTSSPIFRKWHPAPLDLDGDEDCKKAVPVVQAGAFSPKAGSPTACIRSSQTRFVTQQVSPKSLRSPSAPVLQGRKPLETVTVLNPFAIRFSQPRINPYFQQGETFDAALTACKEEPCQIDGGAERSFLRAPFPSIEVVSWRPKIRDARGIAVKDAHGKQAWGEERWFTLDNRRLYCLQKAAINAWPRTCCIAVKVIDAVANDRQELRKFRTTTEGATISVGRSKDAPEDLLTWDWQMELTKVAGADPKLNDFLDAIESEEQSTKVLHAQIGTVGHQNNSGANFKSSVVGPTPFIASRRISVVGTSSPTAVQKITVVSPSAMRANAKAIQSFIPMGDFNATAGASIVPSEHYWSSQYWDPAAACGLQYADPYVDPMQHYHGFQSTWDLQPPLGYMPWNEIQGGPWLGLQCNSPCKVKGVVVPPNRVVLPASQTEHSSPFKGSVRGKGVNRMTCTVSGGGKRSHTVRSQPR